MNQVKMKKPYGLARTVVWVQGHSTRVDQSASKAHHSWVGNVCVEDVWGSLGLGECIAMEIIKLKWLCGYV